MQERVKIQLFFKALVINKAFTYFSLLIGFDMHYLFMVNKKIWLIIGIFTINVKASMISLVNITFIPYIINLILFLCFIPTHKSSIVMVILIYQLIIAEF